MWRKAPSGLGGQAT